jgi:hypothetical protein
MPQSFAAVHLHIVFSTKGREPWLTTGLAPRVYEYLGGVAHGCGCRLLAAGGIPDHGSRASARVDRPGGRQDEYRALLTRHGIEWDERYVWD